MKDYHNFYLKCNVLLLANMSEKLRNNILKYNGLFPVIIWVEGNAWKAMSWKAMLKMTDMTNVELELISDANMYLFFEKCMRGGVTYICERCSKANKKHWQQLFNNNYNYSGPKQEAKHIVYLNVNNVYGYAMSKFLPTSGFKWINP